MNLKWLERRDIPQNSFELTALWLRRGVTLDLTFATRSNYTVNNLYLSLKYEKKNVMCNLCTGRFAIIWSNILQKIIYSLLPMT